jgi:hypothetical protein
LLRPTKNQDPNVSDAFSIEVADDESWANYAHTILWLADAPAMRFDLRVLPSLEQRTELSRRGLGGEFAVVTASNPRGRKVSDSENEDRYAELCASLTARGLQSWRAVGESPDGSHREEGLAVRISRDSALQLACQLEQSAFLWYDGDAFWIIPALVNAHPCRLPTIPLSSD